MNILVAYFTWTGNTKKVAEAIFEVLPEKKEIRPIATIDRTEDYDLIFVGFPIVSLGEPPEEAVDFLRRKCADKKVALFITHGAIESFELLPEWLTNCRKAANASEVLGLFHCQGEISQHKLDAMLTNKNAEVVSMGTRGRGSKGQPDVHRLELARSFAREIIAKISNA